MPNVVNPIAKRILITGAGGVSGQSPVETSA